MRQYKLCIQNDNNNDNNNNNNNNIIIIIIIKLIKKKIVSFGSRFSLEKKPTPMD